MYRRDFPDHPGFVDQVTRVSRQNNPNFFQRICNSLVAIIIGFVVMLIGIGVIFWNEGRAVQTARSLSTGLSIVRPLASPTTFSPDNENHLIHIVGDLNSGVQLVDDLFKMSVSAVKFRRLVEMYQWIESRETREYEEDGHKRTETTFSYSKDWKSEIVDSRGFERPHPNPLQFNIPSVTYEAQNVKVGIYTLSDNLISQITEFHSLHIGDHDVRGFRRHNGFYYQDGTNPAYPIVGDLRISFQVAGGKRPDGGMQEVSVVARQSNKLLTTYEFENGYSIELLYLGSYSAQYMFEKELFQNNLITWGVRFVGWFVLFIAFSLMTSLVTVLGLPMLMASFYIIVESIPLIREIVGVTVAMTNFTLSMSISLVTIAIAWIFYRPWLGWALIMLSVTPFLFNKWSRRRNYYARRD